MDGLTRSSRPEPNGWARGAVLFGLLGVAAVPAAVAVAQRSDAVELLHAAAAIPVAAVLGVVALVLGSRGRRQVHFTLGRVGGDGLARLGRLLGGLALYVALTAALAVGFYGLLNLFD